MKTITYRDLKVDGYDNHYEYEDVKLSSNTPVVKEQIILGMYGYPDMYIRKFRVKRFNSSEKYLIISYTDYELTEVKKQEIIEEAIKIIEQ